MDVFIRYYYPNFLIHQVNGISYHIFRGNFIKHVKTLIFYDYTPSFYLRVINLFITFIETYNAAGTALIFDEIPTGGISSYSAGLALQYGPTQQVASTTKATNTITTASPHGYNIGDTVIFQGFALGTTNDMQLLNGVPFTIVTVPTTTTFTIKWNMNQSTYTDLSASPAGALVKKVLYPFLYPPQDNVISAITLGATTTVSTTMYHNFEIGQEIAFRVPNIWGTYQLNSLPNVLIPGSPVYGYVTSITDNWTFVCSINSAAFTAYTSNFVMTATTLVGLTYPQVVAVGDVNTGGNSFNLSASLLYPPPAFPTSTNRVSTINGPAIKGAFVNNTSQGFFIGVGVGNTVTSATIMTTGDQVYWRAYLSDYASP